MAKYSNYRFNAAQQDHEIALYKRAYIYDKKLSSNSTVRLDSYIPPSTETTNISYSFNTEYYTDKGTHYQPFPTQFKKLVRNNFDELSQFIHITPQELPYGNHPVHITYRLGSISEEIGGQSNTPQKRKAIYTTINRSQKTSFYYNSFTLFFISGFGHRTDNFANLRQSLVNHETGHGIGLMHPHSDEINYDHLFNNNSYSYNLPLNQTVPTYTEDISTMSYYSGEHASGTSGHDYGYEPRINQAINYFSPLWNDFRAIPYRPHYGIMDIFALQSLYGKNPSYNAGNDVYKLGAQSSAYTTSIPYTIYDTAGHNTYDASSAISPWDVMGTAYINANPDIHQPSVAGNAIIYTAFNGPDDIIGSKWSNVIHGSVAHGNTVDLSQAQGTQRVFSGGHNNTILLNPHAYGISTLDYRTLGVPNTPGHDTILGFSAAKDYILISPQMLQDGISITTKNYNRTLADGSNQEVKGAHISFGNSNQSLLLDSVDPAQIWDGMIRENDQFPASNSFNNAYSSYHNARDVITNPFAQLLIGVAAYVLYKAAQKITSTSCKTNEHTVVPTEDNHEDTPATTEISAKPIAKSIGATAGVICFDVLSIAIRSRNPVASLAYDAASSGKPIQTFIYYMLLGSINGLGIFSLYVTPSKNAEPTESAEPTGERTNNFLANLTNAPTKLCNKITHMPSEAYHSIINSPAALQNIISTLPKKIHDTITKIPEKSKAAVIKRAVYILTHTRIISPLFHYFAPPSLLAPAQENNSLHADIENQLDNITDSNNNTIASKSRAASEPIPYSQPRDIPATIVRSMSMNDIKPLIPLSRENTIVSRP